MLDKRNLHIYQDTSRHFPNLFWTIMSTIKRSGQGNCSHFTQFFPLSIKCSYNIIHFLTPPPSSEYRLFLGTNKSSDAIALLCRMDSFTYYRLSSGCNISLFSIHWGQPLAPHSSKAHWQQHTRGPAFVINSDILLIKLK